MSTRAELLESFVREVRQLTGLSASFHRAAAARTEMNVTDLEVIGLLELGGPMTAGQLAELMGLTTGAITGMIDRMEKGGFLRRERDPQDGRRVIVGLATDGKPLKKIAPVLNALGPGWSELAARYSDDQLALLTEFLRQGNAMSRGEIGKLRAPPAQDFTAPVGTLKKATLEISADVTDLFVRVGTKDRALYQAAFEGPQPKVSVDGGSVSISYPRQLRQLLGPVLGAKLGLDRRIARVQLSKAVSWAVSIRGAGSSLNVDLSGVSVTSVEVEGAGSMLQVTLPKPSGVVPVKFGGGGSDITIRRPEGVAVRAQVKGWGSGVAFDDQPMGEVGSGLRLSSPHAADARDAYEIEVSGSGSMVKIGQ
jgi:DNA-binding MarR family transcriptional regulator